MNLNLKNRSRYSFALILSLVLHIFAFAYIYRYMHNEQTSQNQRLASSPKGAHSINLDSVKFITHKQLQEIKNKQIVANELNGKKVAPKESRFAGEADQSFDRQTMAATNGAFKRAGLGNKGGNQIAKTESLNAQASSAKPAQNEKKSKTNPKNLNLSDLGAFSIPKTEEIEKNQSAEIEKANRILASKNNQASALGIENGSADTSGLASNNDFVEEVPLGDMTNLNTTEFKYYGFYHRIRQKLEQYWGSTIQSKAKNLYKSGRRIPASDNLITAISVTIDNRGNIVDIKIDGTSGIRELDQAAIESFNKAGPFPNPPKGLIVDGRAIIHWGFVIKS